MNHVLRQQAREADWAGVDPCGRTGANVGFEQYDFDVGRRLTEYAREHHRLAVRRPRRPGIEAPVRRAQPPIARPVRRDRSYLSVGGDVRDQVDGRLRRQWLGICGRLHGSDYTGDDQTGDEYHQRHEKTKH